MKSLIELAVELDAVFDQHAKDGNEPVYVRVDGRLIPLDSAAAEIDYHPEDKRVRIVVLQGVKQ